MTTDPTEHAQEVDRLRRRYEMDEAEATARAALKDFPESAELRIALGRVLLATRRPEKAFDEFSEAGDPAADVAAAWRIAALSRQRKYTEAKELGRQACECFPRSPLVRVALGRTFRDSSRPRQALPHFEEAARLAPADPTIVSWYAAGLAALHEWGEAKNLIRSLIKQDQDAIKLHYRDTSKLHYRLGRVLMADGDVEEAVKCFTTAIGPEREHARALSWCIKGLGDLCRFDEAGRVFEAGKNLPKFARRHVAFGWVFSAQGEHEKAIDCAEEALRIDPLDSWALRSRVEFMHKTRRLPDAKAAARAAVDLRRDDPEVHTTAAWVLADQGENEDATRCVEDAIHCVERALKIDDGDSWALRSMVQLLRKARQFDAAECAAEKARDRRDDDPEVHTTAAWAYAARDKYTEALECVKRALKMDGRHSWALQSRVEFLLRVRQFDDAEKYANKAIQCRGGDPQVHTIAAWVFAARDKYTKALDCVEQALEINRRDSWALRSKVDILRQAREFSGAERAAAEARERLPRDSGVHTTEAWVFAAQDRYTKAVTCVEQALEFDNQDSWALQSWVVLLRKARKFGDAKDAALKAKERRPGDPDILLELGRVHDDRLEFDAALECFDEVLDRDPGHVQARIARSVALRSQRRYAEAKREIEPMCEREYVRRELEAELAWIHHDAHRLGEARQVFLKLLSTAVNHRECAEAHHGLGWVAFAAQCYPTAADKFRDAAEKRPGYVGDDLGLAWSLVRQPGEGSENNWREAEEIAYRVLKRAPDPSAHICLGILAFKRNEFASAEHHFKKAIDIDPYHGGHTDLGALYVRMGLYDEAEEELRTAVRQDRHDLAAHVEMGNLFLQPGYKRLPDAEREFRQAHAIDPTSSRAVVGLSQALARAGDEAAAETALREALPRQDGKWRTHLALARLLVQRGDNQQNPDIYKDAYEEARQAIALAPAEADPQLVAGVAIFRRGSLTGAARGRFGYWRRATGHFKTCLSRDEKTCLSRDEAHPEAKWNLSLLEREMTESRQERWIAYAVFGISLTLLATMWITFYLTKKVSTVLLSATTPVLMGLLTFPALLPALSRLKLAGFEAELQPGSGDITPSGPTGEVTFGPGRFTTPGPEGQPPRHE